MKGDLIMEMNGVGVNGYEFLFNRKSGKVLECMEGNIPMLKARAVMGKGITATRDYVVVGSDNLIYSYVEETGANQFPKIHKDMVGMDAKKIGIDVTTL